MKVNFTKEFFNLLNEQVAYIAKDKPQASRKFKNNILKKLKKDLKFPFNYKKSIYFDNVLIRDYVFKGYTIVYFVNESKDTVEVFEFIKYIESL
ncbi:type II toxin-antitoxin system RelE/ParE family toxin [Flavobacterium sp.]|uniref:type II toxin-antitoxin system RelE/ParE family toxin n=1 Tax=Flavobacterium sp. TaxID=239 RepID=UPI00286DB5EA|nr:type II toxin-antitoxin system RelE/ParE family toxin [Flavobacterium sp.]